MTTCVVDPVELGVDLELDTSRWWASEFDAVDSEVLETFGRLVDFERMLKELEPAMICDNRNWIWDIRRGAEARKFVLAVLRACVQCTHFLAHAILAHASTGTRIRDLATEVLAYPLFYDVLDESFLVSDDPIGWHDFLRDYWFPKDVLWHNALMFIRRVSYVVNMIGHDFESAGRKRRVAKHKRSDNLICGTLLRVLWNEEWGLASSDRRVFLRQWFEAVDAKRLERRLALVMALHPRLGACGGFGLGALGDDLLRMVMIMAL